MSDLLTSTQLAGKIDLHLHRGDLSDRDIQELCESARTHPFAAVSVHGSQVVLARHCLEGTDVKVAAVVGFPLGAMDADVKRYETEAAIDLAAQEIEAVLNIGRLKAGDARFVLRELRDIVEAADERPVKVILETCLLTQEEKLLACELAVESGAKFVQTSTGFGNAGATIEDVRLLRETVGEKFGVKASGGICDTQTALAMIEAGATRVGTSKGVTIVEELAALTASRN